MTKSGEPQHPIRVVAQRTGLSPDVLRVWERRYQVIAPSRSGGGQRLYSDADIERLGLLHQATAGGRGIGQVAKLTNGELAALIDADRAPADPRGRPDQAVLDGHRDQAMRAVTTLDPETLDGVLRSAVLHHGVMAALTGVVAPLLQQIGEAWHAGRIMVAHEHAASAVVRRLLDWMHSTYITSPGAPTIGLATPPGERHEFGAMLAAVAALGEGWKVLYLGADIPAEDIARAARSRGLDIVGLSIVLVPDARQTLNTLEEIRKSLPESTLLIVGGSGARQLGNKLRRLSIEPAEDLEQLVRLLRKRRAAEG